jgi:hypothetical protein
MLRLHPAYQSNRRAVPIGVLFDLQGHLRRVGRFTRKTEGNPGTIRKQLSCWSLAVEVRPQFQRLLKIEHRWRMEVLQQAIGLGAPRSCQA